MKKFGRFLSDPIVEKEEITDEEANSDNAILDLELIQYIIKEFPNVADEIKDSLILLRNTLEKSIDFIEDRSSEIVKEYRDFDLSGKYRDAAIKLHNISKNITDYSMWMDKELSTLEKIDKNEKIISEKKEVVNNDQEKLKEDVEYETTYIYEDFTAKNPKGFKLEDHNVDVEGWEDMIVKTADILTKHYKNNKNSRILSSSANPDPIVKKSKQNELRDTIIEMLRDHRVSLKSYEVQIREINDYK